MEKEVKITYRITPVDADTVHDDHKDELEALALERIFSQIEEGFREGELFSQLCLETESGEGTVQRRYSGYWECRY